MDASLPGDVADLLRTHRHIITLAEARAAGISSDRIWHLRDRGALVQLAHGCYADAAHVTSLSTWERHALMAKAFAISSGGETFITGWAAVALWRFPTSGEPPALPTVVQPYRPSRGPSRTPQGRILVAKIPGRHLVPMPRWGITSPPWTAVDLARHAPLDQALIVADQAARQDHDLASVLPLMRRWQRVHRARWVVEHADPNSESALETLGRFTCLQFNLPMPVANAWVGKGRPRRRADGLWPYHRAAYEADGAVKYNDRADAATIIRKDREREFELRRLGLDFVRYGAPDVLGDREPLADRFRALLRDNPPGEPIRWWKHVPGVGPVEPEPEDWPSPDPLGLILPGDRRTDYERPPDDD